MAIYSHVILICYFYTFKLAPMDYESKHNVNCMQWRLLFKKLHDHKISFNSIVKSYSHQWQWTMMVRKSHTHWKLRLIIKLPSFIVVTLKNSKPNTFLPSLIKYANNIFIYINIYIYCDSVGCHLFTLWVWGRT